ncbi:MAG: choice-of-anchor D domain-containing protein [Terriglobia bacterium]
MKFHRFPSVFRYTLGACTCVFALRVPVCGIVLATVLVTWTSLAWGQTVIHVPADQPTIQEGINAASDGDTVLVAPGTYRETIDFGGKAITVQSEQGPTVTVIDGTQTDSYSVVGGFSQTGTPVLSGFTILHGGREYMRGITIGYSSSPVVEHNVISPGTRSSTAGRGISVGGDASPTFRQNLVLGSRQFGGSSLEECGICGSDTISVQILGNAVALNDTGNLQQGFGGGITLGSSSGKALIRGNVIVNNAGPRSGNAGGIYLIHTDADLIQNLIAGNISSWQSGGVYWDAPPLGGPRLINNTIVDNNGFQVRAASSGAQGLIANNIMAGGPTAGPALYCDENPPTVMFNDISLDGEAGYGSACWDQTGINGNISADPVFVDRSSADFHLQAASPAIDAGDDTATGLPTTDVDGDARVLDGNGDTVPAVDMGADEYSPVPTLNLSPTNLTFGAQEASTVSPPQHITFTNHGSTAIGIGMLGTGPDYTQTNDCGTSLAAGLSCTINVSLAPAFRGTTNSLLAVMTDATETPQIAYLYGTAVGPEVTLSRTSIGFDSLVIGVPSPSVPLLLSNVGETALRITSLNINGDFAQSNTCPLAPGTLPAGSSCQIDVTFTPTIPGSHTGALTMVDNAVGSPRTVTLAGYAWSAGIPSFSANTILFPDQVIGVPNLPQAVTLTNTGTGPLAFTISGDRRVSVSTDCASPLAAGASCTLNVALTPDSPGANYGHVYIYHDAADSPALLTLIGNGILMVGTPTISGLSPTSVPVGSAGFTIMVSGYPFLPASKVRWNGTDLQTHFVSQHSLQATAPTVGLETAGTAQITVDNGPSGGGESQPVTVSIYVPANYSVSPTDFNYRTISGDSVGLTATDTPVPQMITQSSNLAYVTRPAPFPIHFGGWTFTDLTVESDGTISFQVNRFVAPWRSALWYECPPLGGTDVCQVSYPVFWDVLGTAPNREFVIEWRNIYAMDYGPSVRFQVVFFEASTDILFNYADVGPPDESNLGALGTFASIGVQVAPNFGTQFSYMTPSLTNQMALLWHLVPPVNASPESLSFANQAVGTASEAQTVTLTNSGVAPVDIASVVATDDFAQTNDCGSSLGIGASCTLGVTFAPTAPGSRTGTLTITDNAPGTPVVNLSGTGIQPVVALSPLSLSFGDQPLYRTSAPQTVTLTNTGNVVLNLTSIAVGGDFAQTNNCGASVAAAGSCTIDVTFHPTTTWLRTATLRITDDAANSPQTVALSGTGTVPGIELRPLNLSFGNQALGTTSAPKAVTLYSTGTAPLIITGISTSENFAQTNNCVSPVPARTDCTIQITFTPPPTVAGGQAGELTVTRAMPLGVNRANLNGIGLGPVVTLSSTSLNFGNQPVGTTSTPRLVNLSNTGNAPMAITSIAASGVFAQTNNCPASLAGASYCTISVTFTPPPTVAGGQGGTLTIADDASGSPHVVNLSGTGSGPIASLSSNMLSFAGQIVGTTSPVEAVTLTNSGNAPLGISSIATTGDYALTHNCVSPLAAETSCTLSVTFTPTVGGGRSGTLIISDNAAGSPRTVGLSGTGQDFSLGAFTTARAVSPGMTARFNLLLMPQGGFQQTVSLACSGAPAGATCSVRPSSVTPNGVNNVAVALEVVTTAPAASAPRDGGGRRSLPPGGWPVATTLALLGGLALLAGVVLRRASSSARLRLLPVLGACILLVALVWAACGGGGGLYVRSGGTPAGTYMLTITATTSNVSHNTTVKLTVR